MFPAGTCKVATVLVHIVGMFGTAGVVLRAAGCRLCGYLTARMSLTAHAALPALLACATALAA